MGETEKNFEKGFQYAIYLISYSSKTEHEVKQKLKMKAYTEDDIEKIIEKLYELKYLDDKKYLSNWLSYQLSCNKYSKKQLIHKLQQKGLDKNDIEEALLLQEVDDREAIKKLAKQKLSNTQDKEKIMRHLLNRGFSYADVKNVLENL